MSDTEIILEARSLCQKGKPQEALLILDKARGQSNSPKILIELASVLEGMNLPNQADIVLTQGIAQFPNDAIMAIAFANHCYKHNTIDKGIRVTAPFIALPAASNELLLTHAHLLKASGRFDDAILHYKQVLANDAKNSIALSSLGGIALDLRHYERALEYVRAAHHIDPSNTDIETQLAYAEFRSGNLKNGWAHYVARFGNASSKGIAPRRPHPQPQWDGTPISKGKLLVWCEQAVGEEILYSTMLNDALAYCPDGLIVECDERLKPLFERSTTGMTFVTRSNPPDTRIFEHSVVAQCAAGQLGQFFRNSFADFPKRSVSLLANPSRIKQLRSFYEAEKIRLGKTGSIIGISWKSKPFVQGDPKSSALSDWQIIFEESPHLFISLQYGDITEDMATAKAKNWPLIVDNTINQVQSLDDFAAQVSAMDHVISVSNTTAHMAGACGLPSAILIPASRGLMWHWFDKTGFDKTGFDRTGFDKTGFDKTGFDKKSNDSQTTLTQSPWYPSLTLLRQQVDGEWQDVLKRARLFLN